MRKSSEIQSCQKGNEPPTAATEAHPIEMAYPNEISSIVFLGDSEYIISGGDEGKIQQWRAENGKKVGSVMDTGSAICNFAVTQDGKSVVCGMESGQVMVWTRSITGTGRAKVIEFKAHNKQIHAVDVSADGKKIATGADDNTLCIWSLGPAPILLLHLVEYNDPVVAVKISPDGSFIATATGSKESAVRVYDSSNGYRLIKFLVRVNSLHNQSLAWASSDANRLFALSKDGNIHCLDISAKKTLAKWPIHDDHEPTCIALFCNDTVIAASAQSSVSLWDTTTQQQIGSVIRHSHNVSSMAISANGDIATAGDRTITLRKLCDILPAPYCDILQHALWKQEIRRLRAENNDLQGTVRFLRVQYAHRNRTITHLDNELHCVLAASQYAVNRLAESTGSLLHPQELRAPQIAVLEKTTQELQRQLAASQQAVRVHDKVHECETKYTCGRIYDTADSLRQIAYEMTEDLRQRKWIVDWLREFKDKCVLELQKIGDEASRAAQHNEALLGYSAMLSLTYLPHCTDKPEKQGSTEIESTDHETTIGSFSDTFAHHPRNINDIIVKCCKARIGLLSEELVSVTKATQSYPSDYKLFKKKHAVLHSLGRYKEAFEAYRIMVSTMENSATPQIRYMRNSYIDPTPVIRKVVEQTIRDIPRALIDTTTGRLYDKTMQAAAFEECSMFDHLRSSMIIHDRLDHMRIQCEVENFYEYVMLSHKWQPPEPSFQMVENAKIYALPPSTTNDKLINFCKLVQSRRFRWAWCDTCCVNQSDKGAQQESVVAMFQWYCRAALTIVHLLGVHSKSQRKGSLRKSIWNTRGWTYQEYVASKVIQFYTEDWKPYLDLENFNHKESPLILSEMERAIMFDTQALATLEPGLTRAREKLYLASRRETTRVEDIAYSLFGIFDVALPVIYGEGKRAVGRLLEHILTRSDNVTILAWTGVSGSSHSYLPSDLTVYDQVIPPHVPQAIETAMHNMIRTLQSSLPDPSLVAQLYEQLCRLPPLSLLAGRLRLSGLAFPLDHLELLSERDFNPVYRTISPILGVIRIETKDNLAGMEGLVLVHPWIGPLIDEDFSRSAPQCDLVTRALHLVVRLREPFGGLLLASQSRVQYTRVATDSFIKVQIRAETPLEELMKSIRTVDVQ